LLLRFLALVIASIVLAGCFAGGGNAKARSGSTYKGEFKQFELYLRPISVQTDGPTGIKGGWELYPGARVDAWGFSLDPAAPGTVPGPVLRIREHDTVQITFSAPSNMMAHTIHWHGLHVPWQMDGVPYVSQLPIGQKEFGGKGNEFTYTFQVNQTGTYWYHCHVDTAHHMDMGMYGAFIVDPADPNQDPHYDREAILMLDEWDRSHSHQNTAALGNAMSHSGDPGVTANDMYGYIRDYIVMNGVYNDTILGPKSVPKEVPVAGGTPLPNPAQNAPGVRETRSWYPVTYAPYFAQYDTFLINGKAFPSTEMLFIKSGQTMRIRLVDAGEQVHAIHLHGHHFLVTHKDGYKLPAPYYADTVLIAPGERYDVYVRGDNPGPWMLHDHISLNEANDYIHPGGMMTMLCYEDGWELQGMCAKGHDAQAHGRAAPSGDLVNATYNFLLRQAGLEDSATSMVLTSNAANGGQAPMAGPNPPMATSAAPSAPITLPSVSVPHVH
jgi:FtsP/CotA-like multicopper oxidase with cupredoxin domain